LWIQVKCKEEPISTAFNWPDRNCVTMCVVEYVKLVRRQSYSCA
jgi:hypothetical protein